VLDAMAHIKLNVLHLHLSDDQSFALSVKSRPEIAAKGAWVPTAIHNAATIAGIVNYARYRGIRVVPEIDSPGHTYSFSPSYPTIIFNCSAPSFDVTNPLTYEVLTDLFNDAGQMFPDSYFHLGGDEVDFSCFKELPWLKEWMQQRGMNPNNYADLIQYYSLKLAGIVNGQGKKNMVFWQEAFFNAYKNPSKPNALPNGTIIQVWMNEKAQKVMTQVIGAGFPVLFSAGNYLDQQIPNINGTQHYLWQDTFWDFYANEPTFKLDLPPAQLKLILGGEACLWGEQVDWSNIWTRFLPRAAAVSERLWSPKQPAFSYEASNRATCLRCRLAQRGFPTSALAPDYCAQPDSALT